MVLRQWLWGLLFVLVLGLVVSIVRLHKASGRTLTREPVSAKGLLSLLLTLAALSSGGMACQDKATAQGPKVQTGDPQEQSRGRLHAIRTKLLSSLVADTYNGDERKKGRQARAEMAPLLESFVEAKELSRSGAERLLDLYEECVAHTDRLQASCYEPMPMDWVGWERGSGARERACKRMALLEKLSREDKLDKAVLEKAKLDISSGLASLTRLREFLSATDQKKQKALKQQILDKDSVAQADKASREAAAFVLRLFEQG